MSPSLDYGYISVKANDITAQGSIIAGLDHGTVHIDVFDMDSLLLAELDHGSMHIDAYDIVGVQAEMGIKFLKAEFCRFEENFKTLKARVKITNLYDRDKDNIFTAKIVTSITDPDNTDSKLEYPLTTWTETITESTTKLIKEYDLNLVTFLDGRLPLNIGKHSLEVSLNGSVETAEFSLVPMTVQRLKNQYMLGVDMKTNTELVFQQELRLITGVEILEISADTPVGPKELVWNAANKTLQWDNGTPVEITDEYFEYHLQNVMGVVGLTDGDWLKLRVEDIDELPLENQTEVALVDVKTYDTSDYQYWINNGLNVVTETMIMTAIEPTLYSSDKDLKYKYLDPVMDIPKSRSESSNHSFDLTVNMLQDIIELWANYFGTGSNKINIGKNIISFTQDSRIVVRLYPYGYGNSRVGIGRSTTTIGMSGLWDRTIYAKTGPGARNKTQNYWNATVLAGIPETDRELRQLALDVAAKVAAVDLFVQSGLGRGAGIASRSFSVSGISSSYNTVESAENALLSSSILQLQRDLGTGRATKDEQRVGLVNRLRSRILGDALGFKL